MVSCLCCQASPSRPSLALYQRGTSSSTQLSSPPDVSIVPHQDSQNSETDEDEIGEADQKQEREKARINSCGAEFACKNMTVIFVFSVIAHH